MRYDLIEEEIQFKKNFIVKMARPMSLRNFLTWVSGEIDTWLLFDEMMQVMKGEYIINED